MTSTSRRPGTLILLETWHTGSGIQMNHNTQSFAMENIILVLNILNNISYRFPSKRSFWLSIWYREIEKGEQENPWALAFDEQEEEN